MEYRIVVPNPGYEDMLIKVKGFSPDDEDASTAPFSSTLLENNYE